MFFVCFFIFNTNIMSLIILETRVYVLKEITCMLHAISLWHEGSFVALTTRGRHWSVVFD